MIPELYSEKINSDVHKDLEGRMRLNFDEFVYNFIQNRFKLKKLIKKNCEELILSIIEWGGKDNRVNLLRQFLGCGENTLRREILDIYLSLIKGT